MMPPIVLGYHRILSRGKASTKAPLPVLDCPAQRFRNHLQLAIKSGFKIGDPIQLIDGNYDKSTIFLSFDDGYLETLYTAKEILHGISHPSHPFLCFITGKTFAGGSFEWDNEHPDPQRCRILQEKDMTELSSFTRFGWHTWSHSSLNKKCKTIKEELTPPDNKLILPLFAYPFGNQKKDICNESKEECEKRFKYGFSLFGISNYLKSPSHASTPRLYVSRYWTSQEFVNRLRTYINVFSK